MNPLRSLAPVPPPTKPPPSLEEVLNSASGSSAVIVHDLSAAADRLIDANLALDDVVLRVESEIARLTEIRDAALTQRHRNSEVAACITEALLPDA